MNDTELLMPAIEKMAESITTRILNDSSDIREAMGKLSEAELLIVLMDLAWTMMNPGAIDAVGVGELKTILFEIQRNAQE